MLWISILVGSGDTPKIMAIKEEPLKFAFLVYYYSSYLFTLYSLLIKEQWLRLIQTALMNNQKEWQNISYTVAAVHLGFFPQEAVAK